MTSFERRGGRSPEMVFYDDVSYKGQEYTVGTIQFKGDFLHFIFDKDDYDKVSCRPWHFQSGKYIGSTVYINKIKKELYLHNLVMNRLEYPGKGATESVDHINRNGLDNRKENLRVISQSQQNINQSKKKRKVILPEDCGIDPDSIPKHIWYVRANGAHGDRFAIELKTEGLTWKGTSSKSVSLADKLAAAKQKLEELYKEFPYLHPSFEETKVKELTESFNAIISLHIS
jgi:hypothetical protein